MGDLDHLLQNNRRCVVGMLAREPDFVHTLSKDDLSGGFHLDDCLREYGQSARQQGIGMNALHQWLRLRIWEAGKENLRTSYVAPS